MLSFSLCLQVFHVPVEERKYVSHESSFGEHAADITQAGIVREIMEKTGCTIEMSQAKDQSLTIMVTGRPSSVSEARRMIISSLQQQVSLLVAAAVGGKYKEVGAGMIAIGKKGQSELRELDLKSA